MHEETNMNYNMGMRGWKFSVMSQTVQKTLKHKHIKTPKQRSHLTCEPEKYKTATTHKPQRKKFIHNIAL